jgi:hypothetical protein
MLALSIWRDGLTKTIRATFDWSPAEHHDFERGRRIVPTNVQLRFQSARGGEAVEFSSTEENEE